jgi:predicted small lipoprotein YifL
MQVLSRLILLILVLSFSVAGCAGQGGPDGGAPVDQRDDQTEDQADDQGDVGVPGAPGNPGNDDKVAPGAPIDIPDITNAQDGPVDAAQTKLERKLRKVCGGTVCVTLRTEARDENRTRCQFRATDPGPGTRVPRGSVVVIVTGTQPCDGSSAGGGESSDDGGPPDTGESSEGETSPDDETSSEGETSPG